MIALNRLAFSFILALLAFSLLAAAQSSNEPYSDFFSSVLKAISMPIKFFSSLFVPQATPSPSPDSQAGFIPPPPSSYGTYPEGGYGYPTDTQTLTPMPLLTPSPSETQIPTVTVATGPSPTTTGLPSEIPTVLPSGTPIVFPGDVPTVSPSGTPIVFPGDVPTVLPSGTPPPIDECQVNADCSCLNPPAGRRCSGSQLLTTTAVCVTSTNPNYCACPVSVNNCHYGCQTDATGVASCCPRSGCALTCGDGTCSASETCSNCPADCSACPATCGNGVCEAGETFTNCAADCFNCGNGVCEVGEGVSCPADCSTCGNGVCEVGEGVLCPADCGPVCGDGFCIATENHVSCPSDCPRPACSLSSDCGPTVRTCVSGEVYVEGWNCRNPGLASASCTPWSATIFCSLTGRVCVPNGNDSHCGSPPSSFLPSFVRAANEVIAQVSDAITSVFGNLFKLFG